MSELLQALIHFAAVVAGYVAGIWVARGQERQRAADIVAELTRGWEAHAEDQVRTIAAQADTIEAQAAAIKAWKGVAETIARAPSFDEWEDEG